MEEMDILDANDPLDLYCLHRVFVPILQHAMDEWVTAWNFHSIRSDRRRGIKGGRPITLFRPRRPSTPSIRIPRLDPPRFSDGLSAAEKHVRDMAYDSLSPTINSSISRYRTLRDLTHAVRDFRVPRTLGAFVDAATTTRQRQLHVLVAKKAHELAHQPQ
jgi:hypothetical protein